MVRDWGLMGFPFSSGSTPLPVTMQDDKKKEKKIEYELADIIAEKPQEFTVGSETVFFYPITLAKRFLLKKPYDTLGIDMDRLNDNHYIESFRLITEKRDVFCEILSIYITPNTYKDLYDNDRRKAQTEMLAKVSDEDLITLLIDILLHSDRTELFIKHLGIDKELERVEKINAIKKEKGNNNVKVGGVSIFGKFIGQLKEMGLTINEILFERGYTFLRLLLADRENYIYMTDEELHDLPTADGGKMIDANDPDSFTQAASFFASKGIKVAE